jgi:hypothetical protein
MAPTESEDDHGIRNFNPLSRRGVHAVSYNSTRYGIEMPGNFDTETDYANPRGVSSRAHGMFAAAVLMKHAGISTEMLNFHRHDSETRKKCPGRHVNFSEFEQAVLEIVKGCNVRSRLINWVREQLLPGLENIADRPWLLCLINPAPLYERVLRAAEK